MSNFDIVIEFSDSKKGKSDYNLCKEYHNKHMKCDGWLISQPSGYICEFIVDAYAGIFSLKISKDKDQYKLTETTRYYKGITPRYLDKKEYVKVDTFLTLSDLLDNLT